MNASGRAVVGAAALVLAAGGAAFADTTGDGTAPPGATVSEAARDGVSRGRQAAAALVAEVDAEGPRGVGSEAFAERHAALAERHAEHPGNAAAVHTALAAGESPSSVAPGRSGRIPPGQARKAERLAAADAAAELRGDGRPGLGLGRGHGGGDGQDD